MRSFASNSDDFSDNEAHKDIVSKCSYSKGAVKSCNCEVAVWEQQLYFTAVWEVVQCYDMEALTCNEADTGFAGWFWAGIGENWAIGGAWSIWNGICYLVY